MFSCHCGEGSGVLADCLRQGAVVDELAFAARLDQIGFGQDLQVVRDCARGQGVPFHHLAAIHFRLRGDGLIDGEAGGIAQRLRNLS